MNLSKPGLAVRASGVLMPAVLMVCILMLGPVLSLAADPQHIFIGQIHDREISSLEKEIVSLAEAMPPEKYDFAPTAGSFDGVRTFRLQMTHVATVIYEVSAGVLGGKFQMELGKNENGAENLKSKDEVVKYLKDAFAQAHKAAKSITDENAAGTVDSVYGKMSREGLIDIITWHSYDHYGQAVVYARLCGIIPPASRR